MRRLAGVRSDLQSSRMRIGGCHEASPGFLGSPATKSARFWGASARRDSSFKTNATTEVLRQVLSTTAFRLAKAGYVCHKPAWFPSNGPFFRAEVSHSDT